MVRKKLVLNACGVKSLGGVKLFVEAFELLVESGAEIVVLYSEEEFYNELKNQSLENELITFIKLTDKRYLHPFLVLITNIEQRKLIESYDAVIHFGNFGFKTKNKSLVLLQNVLPFVQQNLKNVLLKYFINRSIKFSEYVIVQLKHMNEIIEKKYRDKIIEIGEIEEVIVDASNKSGKIVFFGSDIPNKNYDFMVKALKTISLNSTITVINPPKNIKEFNCVYTETQDQTLSVISENEIYLHASEHETVGLPIYEAQNLGLKIIIPKRPYSDYFKYENVFFYEYKNIDSAVQKIEEAKNLKLKHSKALLYNENWSKILEYV
jgi:glycosyltransferase involved in cell wall biosynthesis|tara:strand:+ start:44 stop:1009 length:966 start_codon:yes stop_codon:yes gene_type:complete